MLLPGKGGEHLIPLHQKCASLHYHLHPTRRINYSAVEVWAEAMDPLFIGREAVHRHTSSIFAANSCSHRLVVRCLSPRRYPARSNRSPLLTLSPPCPHLEGLPLEGRTRISGLASTG